MEVLISKFHPLLVHFPIVLSILLGFFALRKATKNEDLFKFQLLTCLSLFLTGFSGYFLFDNIEMTSPVLVDHKMNFYYFFPLILSFTFSLAFFKGLREKRVILRGGIFLQLIGVSYISYLGAHSHYGEDYFFEKSSRDLSKFHHQFVSMMELENKVMPILKNRCVKCHKGREAARELRMDDPIHFLLGLERGKLISSCDRNKSEFYKRLIKHDDNKKMMPLNSAPLSMWELEVIGKWIDKSCKIPTEIYRELNHWTFKKIEPSKLPASFKGNPIDHFLGTEENLLGENEVLAKRIYSSLTGMRNEGFLKEAPDKVLIKALNQKAYGEKMASYWLRLHRYADSVGGDKDSFRLGSYRYRDYLIRAFNDDVGLDEILFNQLAADLVENRTPKTADATGFHLVGEVNPSEEGDELISTKLEYADDALGTSFSVNLGLDTRCARCHDHRSNPISIENYYGLVIPFVSVEDKFFTLEEFNKDEEEIEKIKAIKERDEKKYKKEFRELFKNRRSIQVTSHDDLQEGFVRLRGDPFKLGKKVKFALPNFYNGAEQDLSYWRELVSKKRKVKSQKKIQRAILGEWFINDKKGVGLFTARNMANHIWSLYFGKSLIDKPSDQNFSSIEPEKIKLLNYLAFYLVEHKWSLKKLSQHIMKSRAYRAQVIEEEVEEGGTYHSFYPVPKFPGEIRDQILQLSSLLNPKAYGPGIQTELPAAFQLQVISESWYPVYEVEESFRKSIYLFKKRSLILPQMMFMDGLPMPEPQFGTQEVSDRNEVFYFQGSRLLIEASQKISSLFTKKEESFYKVFEHILQRGVNEEERESIKEFIAKLKERKIPLNKGLKDFAQTTLSLNELRFIY